MSASLMTMEHERYEESISKPFIYQKSIKDNTVYCLEKHFSDRKCLHIKKIIRNQRYDNCNECGLMIPRDGSENYKSQTKNYINNFSSQTIFEAMLARTIYFQKDSNIEYLNLRQTYINWIFELAEKLGISIKTNHLAIYLLDIFIFNNIQYNSQLQLYAPVALLVAAKVLEIDDKIPSITKIRSLSNPLFKVEEFKNAELILLKCVEWNPLYTTNLELLEFYLSQGVVNSKDEVEVEHPNINKYSNMNNDSETIKKSPRQQFSFVLKEKNIEIMNDKNLTSNEPVSYLDFSIKLPIINPIENNENSDINLSYKLSQPSSKTSSPNSSKISYHKRSSSNIHELNFECMNMPIRKSIFEDTNTQRKKGKRIKKVNEGNIDGILNKLETDVQKLAALIIKDNDFLSFNTSILAAASIAFLRKMQKFINPWNPELEALSSLKYVNLLPCLKLLQKKFGHYFQVIFCKSSSVISRQSNEYISQTLKSLSITNTPKQENTCQELKLFKNSYSTSSRINEVQSYDSNKIGQNPYAIYLPYNAGDIARGNKPKFQEKDSTDEKCKISNFPSTLSSSKENLNNSFLQDALNQKSSINSSIDNKYYRLYPNLYFDFISSSPNGNSLNPVNIKPPDRHYYNSFLERNIYYSELNTTLNIISTSNLNSFAQIIPKEILHNDSVINSDFEDISKFKSIITNRNITTESLGDSNCPKPRNIY